MGVTLTSPATSLDMQSCAVITAARMISHREFAADIAAARLWVQDNIPKDRARVVLAAALHPYLSWVLRVALLAEKRWQVQEAARTPAQKQACFISPPSAVANEPFVPITLSTLKAYRGKQTAQPVWEILQSLDSIQEPVVTIYTSGSTGQPKGVVLSGAILARRMDIGSGVYGFQSSDCFQCRMGPDTVGGFYLPMEAWRAGASVIIDTKHGSLDQNGTPLNARTTVLMASTTAFDDTIALDEAWLNKERRRVYLAGSRVHPTLAESVSRLVADDVYVVYGSTECGATSYTPAKALHQDPSAVGSVLSGAEVEILDDMGKPAEFGTQGKVAIRSPWAVSAYEGDISGGAFEGGWFFPGDLGVLTQEGDLRITGRTIETLNFGGDKFIASDLETKILDLPSVRDAFVTLVRHQNRERLVVMVVSDETPETLSPAVKGTFHTNLAFTLVPVEQIPRNHMGKLNRPALTASIEQNLRVRPLGADE